MGALRSLGPLYFALALSGLVFLVVMLLWELGLFQTPELWIFDRFIVARANPSAVDPRIILVLESEDDVKKMDAPLRDSRLSQLLEDIEKGSPAVVGLDIYRDLPEPRDGSELSSLENTLQTYGNIVAIFKYGNPNAPFKIPPPRCLKDDASYTRFGFNDLPFEDKTVRRAFLTLPGPVQHQDFRSLPYLLAKIYCFMNGIHSEEINENDTDHISLGKGVLNRFHSSDGAYVNAASGGYQFMQDFKAPVSYKTLSMSDVLNLQDFSVFKNEIVIVGVRADSFNDQINTPYDQEISGPIEHAFVTNQLLRVIENGDSSLIGSGPVVKTLWILLWSVAGVVCGMKLRCYRKFSSSVLIGAGLILLIGWLFFENKYWVPIIAPAIAFTAAATLCKAYLANQEEQQRATLMGLFSQHVSPEIAREIWRQRESFSQGGRPKADKLVATTLFTDLKDFSTISEKMPPSDLMIWLDECLSGLSHHVGEHGGIINKYIGDSIMAIFGVPTPRTSEDDIKKDALAAVKCAVGMVAELNKMNARWKAVGRYEVGLRIGIFTGELMAGVVGSSDRLEYTVIGDSANTASRLESFDKTVGMSEDNTRILIGHTTYEYVKDHIKSELIGSINLKGKSQSTVIYKVLGLAI